MMKKSFDTSWERKVYSRGKQLNRYPHDILVSIVARKFFAMPKKDRKNIKILDLGCGAGNNSKFLAENGFDVYGIDGSKSAIDFCRKLFDEQGLVGNFVRGDFLDLPYKNNFFDLAIDRESLYANRFEVIEKVIRGIHNKMKKGGVFLSFMHTPHNPDRELGTNIEPNTYVNFKEGSFRDTGVAHFADLKELYKLYRYFNIENIIRHSMAEIYDKPNGFMELDEYIIIASKK